MSGKLWTYQRYGCSERTVKMTMSGKLVTLTIQLLRKNSKQNHVWETGHINDAVAQKEQLKKTHVRETVVIIMLCLLRKNSHGGLVDGRKVHR